MFKLRPICQLIQLSQRSHQIITFLLKVRIFLILLQGILSLTFLFLTNSFNGNARHHYRCFFFVYWNLQGKKTHDIHSVYIFDCKLVNVSHRPVVSCSLSYFYHLFSSLTIFSPIGQDTELNQAFFFCKTLPLSHKVVNLLRCFKMLKYKCLKLKLYIWLIQVY